MKKLILITSLFLCSSCMKTLTLQEIGRKPTNKEAIAFVKQYIEESYYDANVKNLKVKEPNYGKIFVHNGIIPMPQSGWVICYQANGKNLHGSYTGIKQHSVGVQNMQLKDHGQTKSKWYYCGGAKFIK